MPYTSILFYCHEKIICVKFDHDNLPRHQRDEKYSKRVVLWFLQFNSKFIELSVKFKMTLIITLNIVYKIVYITISCKSINFALKIQIISFTR